MQEKKEKRQKGIQDTLEIEKKNHQEEVKKLNKSITDLKNQVTEKITLIERLKKEKEALSKRLAEVKDAFLNIFCGPKFRAAVNAIIERFNGDQNRFTVPQKNRIEESLSGEVTINDRKALGKDAVDVAKIITDDKAEWVYIPKEVDEIAEKKWDENQARLRAAADAVIRLSSTSGVKHFDQAGAAAIDEYLEIDGTSVDDIWEEASSKVGYWADYAKRELHNYTKGVSQSAQLRM